jgi:hypothetical protein
MEHEEAVLEVPAENQETDQSLNEQQSTPSAPQFSYEDFQRGIAASQEIARRAQEDARIAREEIARIQQQNQQPQVPAHNFAELNERAANGQFAETTADIVGREFDRRMAPLIAENAVARRSRELTTHLNGAIAAHPYSVHLAPFATQIASQIATAIGSGEISYDRVSDKLDSLIMRAMAQNPQVFNQAPPSGQNVGTQAPSNNPQNKPLPPNVPQGRPSPLTGQSANDQLTESEKFMKEQLGFTGSNEEFRELYYKPGQSRTLNITPKSV